ncbi:hypothetical protein FGE12_22975 [Aggregicoccus sp. 17bor-14]|uniref:hypothetical protein n=1 Tax=Myxococcaceae TaxID=31 RepID=UPI00129CBCC0|nr:MULTISPECIES: hypothetical protein [Myxococcaceae]MBF5045287.1 hypothetical protein [Simulacricoccus sp. 17bor-14]MRI91028.1 hypothetical protein [Aggregicoccus sp. 17bor-14]
MRAGLLLQLELFVAWWFGRAARGWTRQRAPEDAGPLAPLDLYWCPRCSQLLRSAAPQRRARR